MRLLPKHNKIFSKHEIEANINGNHHGDYWIDRIASWDFICQISWRVVVEVTSIK